MMPPGAVLRLILNVPEAFAPPKTEQLYIFAASEKTKMTESRQAIADAFVMSEGEPMTASDIKKHCTRFQRCCSKNDKKRNLKTCWAARKKRESEIINYFDTGCVKLNTEQQAAADSIKLQKILGLFVRWNNRQWKDSGLFRFGLARLCDGKISFADDARNCTDCAIHESI